MNNNEETTKNATEITKFCLGILNDESVKSEIKNLYNPAINIIQQQLMPWIYLALIFILINFILLLLIFLLLFQNKLPRISNFFYKFKK
tara:strand:- start:147 stop:413 length:267 start_codon:yes stop_codon:yes gene_type:complete